ncbi:MAG: DUF2244 domain-containing protein [Pseudomonadota bacterium]
MITEFDSKTPSTRHWLIRPNRSMTWHEAKFFIAGVTLASLTIGLYFLYLGYPLVLPFSGLEALAVAAAFYIVLREGEHTEVVTIADQTVTIEKGKRKPDTRYEFDRTWANVILKKSPNRWYPSKLLIGSHGKYLEIGQFLAEGERQSLAAMLINAVKKNR